MTISFDIPPDARGLLDDLREWSLHEVRPLARLADRRETKYLDQARDVLANCPIDVSPLSIPELGLVLVFVTVDPSQGLRGLRGVVIPQGTGGIKIIRETEERKLGLRCLRQSTIDFTDVRVPCDHMLGDPDDPNGFLEGLNVLNRTRPFCMAWNVGTLRGATDFVEEWARGQVTGFSPRRWRRVEEDLAEIRAGMDDLMRLIINAAWKADHGLPHRTEAAMAKSHGPHVIERSYRRLLQIMGSESSSEQHLLEKWYRDAVCFDLLEGTSQILKLTVGRGVFAAAEREVGQAARAALEPIPG
jgi:alkylation response protein AidB-like acyl-CoA dehydrogenase